MRFKISYSLSTGLLYKCFNPHVQCVFSNIHNSEIVCTLFWAMHALCNPILIKTGSIPWTRVFAWPMRSQWQPLLCLTTGLLILLLTHHAHAVLQFPVKFSNSVLLGLICMSYFHEMCACHSLFAYPPVPGYMGYIQLLLLLVVDFCEKKNTLWTFVHLYTDSWGHLSPSPG